MKTIQVIKAIPHVFLAILLVLSCQQQDEKEEIVKDKTVSAAMHRFVVDDSKNEFYTRFRYKPVTGIGYEPGVGRRDPSSIIKVGDLYYVWYTHCTDPKQNWLNADIWYATSQDGYEWTEMGPAVERGPEGSWDDYSVFTTNILVAEGKYYLVYQAEEKPERNPEMLNVVGMAVADSPDGPWTKLKEPVLRPTPGGKTDSKRDPQTGRMVVIEEGAWDSKNVHDPGILPFKGKYFLYYKGHGKDNKIYSDSKIGLAIADNPDGPYEKHPQNPVINSGHEVWMWPYKTGIATIVDWAGPEKNTVQYSEDGIIFEVVAALEDIPPAGGAYIADKFDEPENGQGFDWGICHYGRSDWNFLLRFECDLKQGVEKKLSFNYFPHYSTVRDVMRDPVRFNVPPEALKGKKR